MKSCMKAVSGLTCKVFRNNVGKTWVGKSVFVRSDGNYFCRRGDVIIRKARRFHAGLCEGSSDAIGWKTVKITPEMVGKNVAVFIAIETKTEKGHTTKAQKNFISAVKKAGGFAGVARNAQDAINIVSKEP